jgi:hypothetical protein
MSGARLRSSQPKTDFDQTRASGTSPSFAGTSRSASLPVVLAAGLGGRHPKIPKPFEEQANLTRRIVHSSKHGSGVDCTMRVVAFLYRHHVIYFRFLRLSKQWRKRDRVTTLSHLHDDRGEYIHHLLSSFPHIPTYSPEQNRMPMMIREEHGVILCFPLGY